MPVALFSCPFSLAVGDGSVEGKTLTLSAVPSSGIDECRRRRESWLLMPLFGTGHTQDHCCFVLVEEKILFSGDAVLGFGSTVFESLALHLQSVRELLSLEPAIVCPSHGERLVNVHSE